jgi:tetratricopeptide (TPR) repeat protein
MTRSVNEANSALFRVREMPYGIARSTAAAAELDEIMTDGPDEARAFALYVLVESYVWGNEVTKAYLPFTQLLRWWDEHPEHFDAHDRHGLFWSFKWMISGLADFPTVPAEQIDRTLADMERRYALAGNGANAVAMSRFQWERARGTAATPSAYDAWVATPRDDFSQCEACEPGDRAAYLFEVGRFDEGIRLLEQVLATSPTCATEPGDMLSHLQLAYLETGDADKAATTHRRGLRHLDNGVAMEGPQGRHIQFLARTGNTERALTRLVEHQDHLLTADSPRDRLSFLLSVGAATSLLAAEHGDRRLALREVPASTVAELDAWIRHEATTLAEAFDARNGTDAVTREAESVWAHAPTTLPVSLSILGSAVAPGTTPVAAPPTRPATPTAAGGAATTGTGPADISGVWGDADLEEAAAPGAEAILARAADLVRSDPASAAGLYQQASADLEAAGELDDAGFALAEAAQLAAAEEDVEGALAAFLRAIALLRAGGVAAEHRAQVVRAYARATVRAGVASLGLATVDKALAELDVPVSAGDDSAPAASGAGSTGAGAQEDLAVRERRELVDTRARLLATLGEHEQASSAAETVAEEYARAGDVASAAHAFWLAGRSRAQAGDGAGAVLALESALDGFGIARNHDSRALVGNELVGALRGLGREDEANEVAAALSGR